MIKNEKVQFLVNKYHENKLSHAFLFVTNDIQKCHQDLIEFIKEINCNSSYKDNCQDCNLCYQIENNIIPNLIEIYPDGQTIKKNQILELQEKFKTKPLYLKQNIYIINNAEKLNSSSSNTMLKFLEEPEENILGFFITNNKESMLETIKSRCQIIVVNYNEENIAQKLGISEDELQNYEDIASTYLNSLINKKEDGILLNERVILSTIDKREQIINLFNLIYLLIDETLNKILTNSRFSFLNNLEIEKLVDLQKKVYNALETIPFNVNIELLLDNFAMEMEEL